MQGSDYPDQINQGIMQISRDEILDKSASTSFDYRKLISELKEKGNITIVR